MDFDSRGAVGRSGRSAEPAAIGGINERCLNLNGLPEPIAAEKAWMASGQAGGQRSSILTVDQLAKS